MISFSHHPLTIPHNLASNRVTLIEFGKQIGVWLNIRIDCSSQLSQHKSEIKSITNKFVGDDGQVNVTPLISPAGGV